MRLNIWLFLTLLSPLCSSYGAYEAKIAVVVDRKAITQTDIESRVSLLLFMTHQENAPSNRSKMQKQAYDMLVLEQLQIKEAAEKLKKSGKVKEQEIDYYIKSIAEQNNMSLSDFISLIQSQSKSDCVAHTDVYLSFRNQIKSQIAWSKLVEHFGGEISDCEIDTELQKAKQEEGSLYELSEIVLYANTPSEKEKLKKQAQEILEQLKKGSSFSTLAQQFSQSTSAKEGGKLGRQLLSQLDPAVKAAVVNLNINDTRMVETAKGIQIIRLVNVAKNEEKSEKVVSFKIASLPIFPDMSELEQAYIENVVSELDASKNVNQFLNTAKKFNATIQAVNDAPLNNAESEEFAKILQKAKEGDIIKTMNSEVGVQVIYIEKKGVRENKPITRDDIKRFVAAKKRNDFGAMYLNKLRARTFVEQREVK